MLLKTLSAAALLAALAAPSAAQATKATEWQYDVTAKAQMTEEWSYAARYDIGASWDPCIVTEDGKGRGAIFDEGRESCPTGPSETIEWDGGESPSLMAVTAAATPQRFYGTKQFTIRGSKTFTGSGINNARHTVTWQWETTYRLVKAKRG